VVKLHRPTRLFICGKSRHGKFLVHRKSRRDRMQAKLKEVKKELRKRMHQPIPEQGRWLGQVVRGYFAYHAVPTNRATVAAFHRYVVRLWYPTLRRRSQKDRFTRERAQRLADWLPEPRNFHPWPNVRFAVKHSR
jgi:RNA-directed DNA polymerase